MKPSLVTLLCLRAALAVLGGAPLAGGAIYNGPGGEALSDAWRIQYVAYVRCCDRDRVRRLMLAGGLHIALCDASVPAFSKTLKCPSAGAESDNAGYPYPCVPGEALLADMQQVLKVAAQP